MEIMSVVLEVLIIFELGALTLFFLAIRKKKRQPKNKSLQETSRMVRKILLNNKWENIDDMIDLLRKDSIHIDFKLR